MRNLLNSTALTFALLVAPVVAEEVVTPTADTVVATVNGTEIKLGHVILLRSQLPEAYLTAPDDLLFEAIVEQLVDQTVLAETAVEDTTELRLTLENEERALRSAIAIDAVLAQDFDEADFQELYDSLFGEPALEYNASHILVETAEEAQALIEELNAGADFAELARTHSTGPSGPNGGDLGWFAPERMVVEFADAVVALEVGMISQEPVQTQFGWHIILLKETRDVPPPSLDEVRNELLSELQSRAIDAKVEALRDTADISVDIEGIDPAAIRALDLLLQ